MRRYMIAVASLALVAGCAEEPVQPVEPQPLPGETFADPEDPAVEACVATVSRQTGTPAVAATGMASTLEGLVVTVNADGDRWHCRVDDRGRVVAITPL